MNADKFFEKYSIEEISKKTKISPISLEFIKNKEFDKIPKAKFIGFIQIIEKEFNVNLSDLKEEYDFIKPKEETSHIINTQTPKKNFNKIILLFISAFLLLAIGGYLLYKDYQKNNQIQSITNETNSSNNKKTDNTTFLNPKESNNTITSYNQTTPKHQIGKK